ncbi:MAG: PP2C family protein-serine/threonine phosphatase [Bacteroidota bacterium]
MFYRANTRQAEYLKDRGTALGMIKTKDYCNFIDTNVISYTPGDIMVLYTDGITEAKDQKGEEFGDLRLKETVLEMTEKEPKEISEHMISKLYEFSGTHMINDDYTTMIVKFR